VAGRQARAGAGDAQSMNGQRGIRDV